MMVDVTCKREVMSLVGPLADLTDRIGLKPREVETLIAVHGGVWPMTPARRELWWPTQAQADRVGALFEVCASAVAIMGDDAQAWFRRRNIGLGQSPIGFLLNDPQGPIALRNILMREIGHC